MKLHVRETLASGLDIAGPLKIISIPCPVHGGPICG
jgi:hypothetical protein